MAVKQQLCSRRCRRLQSQEGAQGRQALTKLTDHAGAGGAALHCNITSPESDMSGGVAVGQLGEGLVQLGYALEPPGRTCNYTMS